VRGTSVPLVDLAAVHEPLLPEFESVFRRVLESQRFVGGEEVEEFEAAFADYLGVRHAIGVGSGTAALQLALVAAGIGQGDEVLIPVNTFFGTAEAVLAAGAIPVLVDVDEDTALMDLDAAASAVTGRTTAIVPVHLYGQPVDADAFGALARRTGLFHLEDAAQAVGAEWRGRRAGGLGNAAGFSFYPTKNLGALGDGGAVTTNDPELARRLSLLRSHGESPQYHHQVTGFNERLDALQAAVLGIKLAHLDADQRLRDEAADYYDGLLAGLPGVRLLEAAPDARHVRHLYVVRVARRDAVLAALRGYGVGAQVHYPVPLHHQPALARPLSHGSFPVAERLAASILSLPLFPRMTCDQIEYTVDRLATALAETG
jgi:dTDP-4-amino-4,6-dideoxygalactose transaminase